MVTEAAVESATRLSNWIAGRTVPADSGAYFEKHSPHDGRLLSLAPRSGEADIDMAVREAQAVQPAWADVPAVQRGTILHRIANALEARIDEIAAVVAVETGKSLGEAKGETGGGIALARFFAGEGQRLYGRTTTSGAGGKYAMTVRRPCGVAGLIVPANTPIANLCWKTFPALICGNAVVLKSAEDAPGTADIFAEVLYDTDLPSGVFNVVHGFGTEAGVPLVEHPNIDVISFTGSTGVGRWIGEACGRMMRKVSLELGGKNPLVVCDDADLDNAVRWTCLSAFSNAGQRCASGSRIIIFEPVYDAFKEKLLEAVAKLKVGPYDGDDFGPVINQRQLDAMIAAVAVAKENGAKVLAGGERMTDPDHAAGWYMAPTVIEGAGPKDELSVKELFGPVACLYCVPDYDAALAMANDSPYGLTASIHTTNVDRAIDFTHKVRAGVAVVNAGTYGSEPHMPFGGVGQSGNGTREPGTEALDVYSNLKDIYIATDPARI
jgi:acyl-CoA reductase-like NAD-dependent aldehyde dehydrogenase